MEQQPLPVHPWIYRWASGLFLIPPDAKTLSLYRAAEGRALLDGIASHAALMNAVDCLVEAAQADDGDAAAARFAVAHSRAFLTGTRHAAPPYASFWLSDNGLLFQEPTRAMNRLFAELGLQLGAAVKEPADHISVQLNLFADLAEREAGGETAPIRAEDFARDHIMTWLPAFSTACRGLRNPYFYSDLARGVTDLLSGTLSDVTHRESRNSTATVGAEPTANLN